MKSSSSTHLFVAVGGFVCGGGVGGVPGGLGGVVGSSPPLSKSSPAPAPALVDAPSSSLVTSEVHAGAEISNTNIASHRVRICFSGCEELVRRHRTRLARTEPGVAPSVDTRFHRTRSRNEG